MKDEVSSRRDVYLDVAPLFEREWTGIPIVTAQLAKHGLLDPSRKWRYLYNNIEISRSIVEMLLRTQSGCWLEPHMLMIMRNSLLPLMENSSRAIGLFPNVKPVRSIFWREAMIVHDLSTLVTPQYHNGDTIAHHANRIRGDIESSQMLFCVSHATAEDVSSYFRVDEERLRVAHLGAEWPLQTRIAASRLLNDVSVDPFVLIVGTLEPRKNASIVFDFLLQDPSVLNRYSFVFVGREGWLDERKKLDAKLSEMELSTEKIIFSGYVSEAAKMALLCAAEFSIYPSLFEGFGLPALESISVGCPVLCSLSSSLPEVVDSTCLMFDPTDVTSFSMAFSLMEKRYLETRDQRTRYPLDVVVPEGLGWQRFTNQIEDWLREMDCE